MTQVINLNGIRMKKHETQMEREVQRFIREFILPRAKQEEKARLLDAFATNNVTALLDITRPYMIRYKMLLEN